MFQKTEREEESQNDSEDEAHLSHSQDNESTKSNVLFTIFKRSDNFHSCSEQENEAQDYITEKIIADK